MSRHNLPPAPTSGAWREGDPVAFRQFANLGAQRLENGSILPSVTLAYETWGTLNDTGSNAVLISQPEDVSCFITHLILSHFFCHGFYVPLPQYLLVCTCDTITSCIPDFR